MACGGIAGTFTRDLLLDPRESRDVDDVAHQVVAVASSSSVEKAKKFANENKCPSSTKAYGSYEELVRDNDVQIVYVASPHAQHYENTLLALQNGKHVCCEKPFTINAKQTKHLIDVAREKVGVMLPFCSITVLTLFRVHSEPVPDGGDVDTLLPCRDRIATIDPSRTNPRPSRSRSG